MDRPRIINRNYGLLWSASLISQSGDTFYAIALAWFILEQTRSPAAMGLYLVASYLPGFLISPWIGVLIDRSDRKRILVAADLVRGLVVVLAAAAALSGRLALWHVLAVAVLLSVCSAFFNPTARVVIPRIVPDDRLVQANAGMQLIAGVTSVAGPLLGAACLGLTGYAGAFLVNALSFVVSGGLIAGMGPGLQPVSTTPSGDHAAGVRGGFRFLADRPRLLLVLGVVFGVHLLFGSLAVILPFLADQLAGRGILNLGVLEASMGAGLLAGSLLLGLLKLQAGERLLYRVLALMGAGLLGLGLLRIAMLASPFAYAVAMLLTGTCVSVASVSWTTVLQRSVPEDMAGRIFSLAASIGNIALPLAYGAAGVLLQAVPLPAVLVTSGLLIITLGLAAAVYTSRGLEAADASS